MVSIPACHAGDRGSIPRRGGLTFCLSFCLPTSIEINYLISTPSFHFQTVRRKLKECYIVLIIPAQGFCPLKIKLLTPSVLKIFLQGAISHQLSVKMLVTSQYRLLTVNQHCFFFQIDQIF